MTPTGAGSNAPVQGLGALKASSPLLLRDLLGSNAAVKVAAVGTAGSLALVWESADRCCGRCGKRRQLNLVSYAPMRRANTLAAVLCWRCMLRTALTWARWRAQWRY